MFVIKVTYKCSLDEINKQLELHRLFLDRQYDEGIFIASGPQTPRVGGVILATGKISLPEIKEILMEDPFHKNNLAEYEITEFSPLKYHKSMVGVI
ncbi:YciI family protein [Tatumella sp. JGM118]|uniref:YciI family protein n=1 Tax=Tatumella sp. JGM118 TaxID=2799796 RepID=UPI001BB084AC|nr:YciI family protein [Tatumella sp. JGM118]MBS0908446.1 hypothetical protein [Tatumella sp. JGM118]